MEAQLQLWNAHPEKIDHYFEKLPPLRLGHYCEQLLLFFFKNDPAYAVLAHNLQLKEGKQTRGEIDFLIQKAGLAYTLHLELAVKFYCQSPLGTEPALIGPNAKDRLNWKWDKLIHKQLELGKHPQVKALSSQAIQSKVILKGRLFKHFKDQWRFQANYVSDQFLKGQWCYPSELEQALPSAGSFAVLPKTDWLGYPTAAQLDPKDRDLIITQLTDHFQKDQQAVLLAYFKQDQMSISEYFFILPSAWPLH
jgi:hypothetical protein